MMELSIQIACRACTTSYYFAVTSCFEFSKCHNVATY
jgi:hypothetical protein